MKLATVTVFICLLLCVTTAAQETTPQFPMLVSWSPDSQYLTFTGLVESTNAAGKKDYTGIIYICKVDGSGLRRLTNGSNAEFVSSWSAKKIAYAISTPTDKSTENIVISNAEGTGAVQLTKNAGRNSAPHLSADGKMIAFTSTRDGSKGMVYVMHADGTGAKRLTTDPTGVITFYNPIWSPDGKRIVYYTEKGDKKDQIWVMNADGSKQTLLTSNIAHNFYPSWSTDGKRILFISNRDGEHSLYTMKADGTDIKRVAGVNTSYARMSSNGKHLAYVVGKFPKADIFVSNADGSNPVNITADKH